MLTRDIFSINIAGDWPKSLWPLAGASWGLPGGLQLIGVIFSRRWRGI